ncbi:MAG: hypothetical protein AB1608_01565 [Thermoproteota archaeon]
MFVKTENNYKFILALWFISLLITYSLHQVEHDDELKQIIRANIHLVPQLQMLAYAGYLGLYLYLNVRSNIDVPKYERTLNNAIKLLAKSATSISIVYIDLIMITVLTFSVFGAAYDIGNNIPYNWHMLFLHVIAPLMALFMTWNLQNQKIKLRGQNNKN